MAQSFNLSPIYSYTKSKLPFVCLPKTIYNNNYLIDIQEALELHLTFKVSCLSSLDNICQTGFHTTKRISCKVEPWWIWNITWRHWLPVSGSVGSFWASFMLKYRTWLLHSIPEGIYICKCTLLFLLTIKFRIIYLLVKINSPKLRKLLWKRWTYYAKELGILQSISEWRESHSKLVWQALALYCSKVF